ncbi:MAG: HAD-IB family hydrolase [Lysobacteraceae bacterium]|nr:MAG: HAD-IB family hydrolase [Xanthomonadaceae bacterium]
MTQASPAATDLALFDFDHTLTHADSFGRFLRDLATPAQLAAARWKLGPWLAGYRLGLVSAARLRARAVRLAFTGRSEAEIRDHGARHARDVLAGMLRPEMMQRLAWHRGEGHAVVLVSASLDVYLQPWCDEHGLQLICNRLEARKGVLSGRYDQGDCGPHKARHIRARYDVAAYRQVHAYGDSREDLDMLALAQQRWYRGRLLD